MMIMFLQFNKQVNLSSLFKNPSPENVQNTHLFSTHCNSSVCQQLSTGIIKVKAQPAA